MRRALMLVAWPFAAIVGAACVETGGLTGGLIGDAGASSDADVAAGDGAADGGGRIPCGLDGTGTLCGSICASTDTDPNHCGACNVHCTEDCVGGHCHVVLARHDAGADGTPVSFGRLRIDLGAAYYVVIDEKYAERVEKAPLSADHATAAVQIGGCSGCDPSVGLAIDNLNVYFGVEGAATSSIRASTKAGNDVGLISSTSSYDRPASIAVDDRNVYWMTGPASASTPGTPVWVHANVADGTPSAQLMSASGAQPSDVATDGTRVYWVDIRGGVYSVLGDGGVPTTLMHSGNPTRLVVSDGALFWTDQQGQQIVRLSLASGGSACVLANTSGQPQSLAVRGDSVYFIASTGSASGIYRVPSACAPTPPTPALLWKADSQTTPVEIAADDANVYWLEQADGGTGSLHRIATK